MAVQWIVCIDVSQCVSLCRLLVRFSLSKVQKIAVEDTQSDPYNRHLLHQLAASQPSQPIDNSYTIISTFLIEHKNHDHIKRQELDDPLKSFHVQYHHNLMRIVKF